MIVRRESLIFLIAAFFFAFLALNAVPWWMLLPFVLDDRLGHQRRAGHRTARQAGALPSRRETRCPRMRNCPTGGGNNAPKHNTEAPSIRDAESEKKINREGIVVHL